MQGIGAADQVAVGLPAVMDRAGLIRPGAAAAVGDIDRLGARVVIGHLPVEHIGVHWNLGLVDRQLVEVGPDAVSLGVVIGEGPAQQHLVRRQADAGHRVPRREGRLLDLGEEVLRVAVQRHPPDRDQRIVLMRPGLGQVEGVDPIGRRLGIGHDLDRQIPRRMFAALNGVEQVAAVEVGVGARHGRRLGVREEGHALAGVEVILDPEFLARRVDPHIGVGAVAVHLAPGARQAPLTHQIGHLVSGLGVVGPEVPLHVVVAQAGVGQAFLAADEVRELHRIAHEENRGVVPDQVVVALGRVELQRKSAHVAPGVRTALFARHGGEARQHLGLGARLKQRRLGVG
ncbi:hypothetical protein D3C73_867650 [compost metagenome]